MRKFPIFYWLIFSSLMLHFCCIFPTQARWANYEDAPAEIEFYNSDIIIDQDGNSEEVIEKQTHILNEMGRNSFSTERIHFNENVEKIEIIEAKTIIDGKNYVVPNGMIEIKPLASEIHGFDQLFQILISYPNVGLRTKTYLKYKVKTLKQPLPKYFSTKRYYGLGIYSKRIALKIKSELPLHVLINDPHHRTEVKNGKEGKYHILEINSKKPAYDALVNEPASNQIPDHLLTWLNISTFKRFEDFSKAYAPDFEKVIQQDLPPLQESIKKAAENIPNAVDQINQVTSLLSEKVRYMGDWRTIEGRLSPRSLKAVAESGIGDCKDFSASAAAILRALGYQAQVAVVMRGVPYLPPEKSLPGFGNFNHAIVKVTAKDGKVFWIDPTNFVSMADGIFPDISDRPAWVLDTLKPSHEKIPSIHYQHSGTSIEETMEIKDAGILKAEGTLKLTGEAALESTGAALSQSLQLIEEGAIQSLCGETSPLSKKIILPPLDSRIVKDLVVSFSYELENNLLRTNMGSGILLSAAWSHGFVNASQTQEGTTFVGLPMTLHRTLILNDVDGEQTKALAYHVKTPWLEAQRTFQALDCGIKMIETVSFLKSFIAAKEIKSKEFQELRKTIKKYCSQIALIVTKSCTDEEE